jgi:hypothetical protein
MALADTSSFINVNLANAAFADVNLANASIRPLIHDSCHVLRPRTDPLYLSGERSAS